MKTPQVLVVGSGPAGLAAAFALAKNGIPVRIIEKDAQHHKGFRGAGVQPRTQELEYFLGILDDVHKHSVCLRDINLHLYTLQDPFKKIRSQRLVEEVKPTPAFPFTEPFSIAQYLHQAVWREHLEKLGISVELGAAATAVEQDADGVAVDITKMSGSTEVVQKAKFAYVIGADGGHSTVRKLLGLSFLGETREAGSIYIADVRVKGFEESDIHNFGKPDGNSVMILYTGEPGRYQFMLRGPQTDFARLNANKDVETLQEEFRKIINRTDIEMQEVIWQAEWRPNIRMAERFRAGRVFLAGDAAHAHSPAGGQGLNSSIADSVNLGWKLALVLKGQAPPSLLDSYELERIPIITEMLQISTSLHDSEIGRAVQLAKEAAQQKEDAAKSAGNAEGGGGGFMRGWKLFQLDLNYRHSPFVNDERYAQVAGGKGDTYGQRGHDIRAGDRAPDAPELVTLAGEGKKTRLFDVFDPTMHTVLVFSSAGSGDETRALTQPILSTLGRLAAGLVHTVLIVHGDATEAHVLPSEFDYVLKDAGGYAFKNYGFEDGKPAVVVVRPDSYIGAFARSATSVKQYFDTVFRPVLA